jgi:hypothetical protein
MRDRKGLHGLLRVRELEMIIDGWTSIDNATSALVWSWS